MPATPTELLLTWESMVITLSNEAAQMRDLGMLDAAALIRNRRDTLKACAESLRDALGLPPLTGPMAEQEQHLVQTTLEAPHSSSSSPTPSPAALRLANTLSKCSLRILAGTPPGRSLERFCNTIADSRGETEPPTALDLQAAAIVLWSQKHGTPHQPHQPQPTQEAPAHAGSPTATGACPVTPGAPALHPTKESSHEQSSDEPSETPSAHKQAFEQLHQSLHHALSSTAN